MIENSMDFKKYENRLPYGEGELAKKWEEEEQKIRKQFKEDAITTVGLKDYPLKEKVYQKAWEDGHSSGYEEVYNQLLELSDLVIPD